MKLAFEPGGPKNLEISTKLGFRNTVVTCDGVEIGRVASKKELRTGLEFQCPDGSVVRLDLATPGLLRVGHNGRTLEDSPGSPETMLKAAWKLILVWAAVSLGFGLYGVLEGDNSAVGVGPSLVYLVLGGLFAVLGLLVRQRSMAALVVVAGLMIGDLLLRSFAEAAGGHSEGWVGAARWGVLVGVYFGYHAIKDFQQRERDGSFLPMVE